MQFPLLLQGQQELPGARLGFNLHGGCSRLPLYASCGQWIQALK